MGFFSWLQIVFSCRKQQQKNIVALVSASNGVYELYTPASCSRSPLKDVKRKKQQPCIVYLRLIRLPPTWWNIISMLIFTPRLQVCSIFKKKNPFFLHKQGGVLIRDMEHGHPSQSSLGLLEWDSQGKNRVFFSVFVFTDGMAGRAHLPHVL